MLDVKWMAIAERVNNSSPGGLFWSTAKEEEDLLRKADPNDDSTAVASDELDGGFSSLDGMLQWAIGMLITSCSSCFLPLALTTLNCF